MVQSVTRTLVPDSMVLSVELTRRRRGWTKCLPKTVAPQYGIRDISGTLRRPLPSFIIDAGRHDSVTKSWEFGYKISVKKSCACPRYIPATLPEKQVFARFTQRCSAGRYSGA